MRKILTPKFWSLGTSLGSMGSGPQKGPLEIFSNVVFLHPQDPNKAPDNAFGPSLAEKLKRIPTRCVIVCPASCHKRTSSSLTLTNKIPEKVITFSCNYSLAVLSLLVCISAGYCTLYIRFESAIFSKILEL